MAVHERGDRELLRAYLQGDAASFDALVDRYARDLYGFLYRFVGDAALAEDLVQETFLQIHVAADSFDLARPLKPWLYTIAANKARDLLRSRVRRQERSLDAPGGGRDSELSLADAVEAAVDDLEQRSDANDDKQRVRALIARMPEHLRMILILGYYQQLPYADIAEILGIPVGTVKSRLHSAVTHFGNLWRSVARDPQSADASGSP
ncbi:MAG: ECF RNA polymerase sigma factor SigW [Phycisphaerae bacterium]|nr:ECF RNA polymerase sigma factor SigW [Phycisphaerae bacterium]